MEQKYDVPHLEGKKKDCGKILVTPQGFFVLLGWFLVWGFGLVWFGLVLETGLLCVAQLS